jgi:parvulin-like peptidyl-prolyl isomerase
MVGSKKRFLTIIGVFAGIAASLLLTGAMIVKSSSSHTVLLSVNNREISAEEFSWHLNLNRALVADYFKQTYGVEYSDEFWTTWYSGETPLQKLVDETKAQLIRQLIEQQLSQQAGLAVNSSFEEFLQGMDDENARRSKAAGNNEVVYGPIHLEAQAYYSYYMSNLENTTIEAMIRNQMIALTEEQLMQEYERNKAEKYTSRGAIHLEWATLSYGSGTEYKDKQSAVERMKLLKTAVSAGADFNQVAEELGVNIGEAQITNASRRTAMLENPLILKTAEQLSQGQISGIIEENGAVHLLHCNSVGEDIVQSFEQVEDQIALQLAQKEFRSTIEQKIDEAVIKWNNSLAMRLAYEDRQ